MPYLHIVGAKGSGKTQTLDVLAHRARNANKTQLTGPALGNAIEHYRQMVLHNQSDHMTSLLVVHAASYKPGAKRSVMDPCNGRDMREYSLFGSKAFAGTEPLPEDLADRTIVISSTPKPDRRRPRL